MRESGAKISFKLDNMTPIERAFVSSGDERFQIACKTTGSGNSYDPESEYYFNCNFIFAIFSFYSIFN